MALGSSHSCSDVQPQSNNHLSNNNRLRCFNRAGSILLRGGSFLFSSFHFIPVESHFSPSISLFVSETGVSQRCGLQEESHCLERENLETDPGSFNTVSHVTDAVCGGTEHGCHCFYCPFHTIIVSFWKHENQNRKKTRADGSACVCPHSSRR